MALQYSVAVRNAKLDAVETTVGTSAVLKIRTGAAPANCATADSGTVLATCSLPSDWMAAASGGTKAKAGTWEDTSADAAGTAAHFRLYASDGTTCHAQGTATATGADEPQVTRRGDDAPVRTPAFVPEVPGLAEIEEVIQAEIKQPRAKTRKVKREVTRQIISLAGLFAEDIPPVVYRQVDKAISRIESNPDDHLIYAAIQLAIIKAIEDGEEDEMMMLLMVA